jgi:hypothetical protein
LGWLLGFSRPAEPEAGNLNCLKESTFRFGMNFKYAQLHFQPRVCISNRAFFVI